MATQFPGPYGIQITYVIDGLTHSQEINVNTQGTPAPGAGVGTVTLETKDLLGINLDVAVNQWVAILAPFFHTTVTFSDYILWKYDALSTSRTFITTASLALIGTAVAVTRQAGQLTFGFRTQEGNTMRTVLLEPTTVGDTQLPIGSLGAGIAKTLTDYILAAGSWFLARDTSYPISGINMSPTQNERVYKRRFRQ